jgi:hypothetical protein
VLGGKGSLRLELKKIDGKDAEIPDESAAR